MEILDIIEDQRKQKRRAEDREIEKLERRLYAGWCAIGFLAGVLLTLTFVR